MRIITLGIVCFAIFGFVNEAEAAGKTLAIIVPTVKIPVLQVEADAAVEEAKKLGYETLLLTHDFDAAKELQAADLLITKGVAGVAWNVADPATSGTAVKKVRDAGIPVVNMDRVLSDLSIANASLGSDNFQCGALVGQAFVDIVGSKGEYAELTGPATDEVGKARSAGYHSVIDKVTGLHMVAQQAANFDQTKAFEVAGSVLQAHPEIVGFITLNDPMGLGAAAALKQAGGSKAIAVGIDGGSDAVDAIKSGGAFKATAAQPLVGQGQTAVDLVDKLVNGKPIDAKAGAVTLVPCTLLK